MTDIDSVIKAIPPREWEAAFWPGAPGNALGWATGVIDVADVRRLVETISRVVREQAQGDGKSPDAARMTDIDTAALREEWGHADEAGQREWALDHADALLDEVDRLRATVARVEALRVRIVTDHRIWSALQCTRLLTAALTPDTKETDR